MADHYGSSEVITGHLLRQGSAIKAFTKRCPQPEPMVADVVRAGVERALTRVMPVRKPPGFSTKSPRL
jgi:hypothetical protein